METRLDCLPCFVRQCLIALDLATDDEGLKRSVFRELFPIIQETDFSKPPAATTSLFHRRLRMLLNGDPYAGVKRQYNALARQMLPALEDRVRNAGDPLRMAVRMAIAGNIIDFGVARSFDLQQVIERAAEGDLHTDEYSHLSGALAGARTVLYLCDNAGEIVFDRLLIEAIVDLGLAVTAVVKGGPVINDATMADARAAGLQNLCRVMDNGSDDVGTCLENCSEDFLSMFESADVVISKGQANFETLQEVKREVFFLFQAKCDVLARELGVAKGALMLKRGKGL